MKAIEQQPITYENWIDSGRIIVPCLKGTPIVPNWNDSNFKITKEEWKTKYTHCAIGLRLDQDIDFDEVLHFVWEEKWSKYNMGGR